MLAIIVIPIWIAFALLLKRCATSWRDSLLGASVCWAVVLTCVTEGLSSVSFLRLAPLVLVWGFLCLISLFMTWRSGPSTRILIRCKILSTTENRLILAAIGLICMATAITATCAPPNNWDSMTYHLARVGHWVDNQSVRHYPTHNLRQLYLGPWAEFAILNFQILAGSDRLAPFVQLLAMLGCLVGVSRLAQRLGADVQGQIFASLVCATIPMGILQSSSTQTDYVAAFWLVCFLNCAFELARSSRSTSLALFAGASLGLAALTKATAVLFAIPFGVVAATTLIVKERRSAMRPLFTVVVCAMLINIPHLLRNRSMFGTWTGDPVELSELLNATHSPKAIVSNLVRNVVIHSQGLPVGASILVGATERFHHIIGWDVNNERTTFHNNPFVLGPKYHEDYQGNPLHLALIAFLVTLCLLKRSANPAAFLYSICTVVAFILFCAVLKWQPWHSRLQLPLFVVGSALCGLLPILTGRRQGVIAVSALLFVGAIMPAMMNRLRPLVSSESIIFKDRTSLYFAARTDLLPSYMSAVRKLDPSSVGYLGLISEDDSWEYPVWIFARFRAANLKIVHVDVRNASKSMEPPELNWIIVIDHPPVDGRLSAYDCVFESSEIRVYRLREQNREK